MCGNYVFSPAHTYYNVMDNGRGLVPALFNKDIGWNNSIAQMMMHRA